ncbi:hypothetical protein BWQ96_04477 [Gracilariopsis chorda]|uniref:Uncharacterized protein n=1 Tax=Gracilariopsis chorda TaxID=448386 RepID=A0A2V3IUF5_9FLOR|nr:hypothetical protein BWQ96_04477 [Gracilariopsis chorda]|eukprot:PXF45709.1 hypothetical protein BWQ96_04477 [Gracilariopsis chorda]
MANHYHPPPDEQLHYYNPPQQQQQPLHTSHPAQFNTAHASPFPHASAPPEHDLGSYTPSEPFVSAATGAQAHSNGNPNPYYAPPSSHHSPHHSDPFVPAPADHIHISNLTDLPPQQKREDGAAQSLSAQDPYQLSEQFYQNVRTVEVRTVDDVKKRDDKSFCFFLFGVLLGAVSGPIAYCTLACQNHLGFVRKRRICFVWGVFTGLCTTIVLAFAVWYTRYKDSGF